MRFGANNAHRLRSHALMHPDKLSTGFSNGGAFRNAKPSAPSIVHEAFTGTCPSASTN